MPEEKKSKGKGCLIALGIVAALFVIIGVGATIFFYKAKDVIFEYADALGVSPQMIEEVEHMNQVYAFEPPSDQVIHESQIQKIIAIKKAFAANIKQHEAKIKQIDERVGDSDPGFAEMREALGILGNIRHEWLDALKKNKMSPKEYQYLHARIYETYLGAAYQTSEAQGRLQDESLRQKLEDLPEQNIKLLDKYKTELENLDTWGFEFWGLPLAHFE
ncbi:MAG: hypothetical protein ACYS17_15000 [Planctomycetota bacterium]|jgi:hypothetical protein